jgi:DNA-binding transcriptional regulator YiaG
MIFVMPTTRDLASDTTAILQAARALFMAGDDPMESAKFAACEATREIIGRALAPMIEDALTGILATHEMIWGEREPACAAVWDEALDDAVTAAFVQLRQVVDEDTFGTLAVDVALHQAGRVGDVARELAQVAATRLVAPQQGGRGRWLAAVGIVAEDLQAIVDAKPLASPQDAYAEADGAAEPTPEELADAFNLFRGAVRFEADDYAARFGVSRNTFTNWTEKRNRPRITLEHARSMVADVDRRCGDLAAAARIFARVRSPVTARPTAR